MLGNKLIDQIRLLFFKKEETAPSLENYFENKYLKQFHEKLSFSKKGYRYLLDKQEELLALPEYEIAQLNESGLISNLNNSLELIVQKSPYKPKIEGNVINSFTDITKLFSYSITKLSTSYDNIENLLANLENSRKSGTSFDTSLYYQHKPLQITSGDVKGQYELHFENEKIAHSFYEHIKGICDHFHKDTFEIMEGLE